jgi:hypothetical protein
MARTQARDEQPRSRWPLNNSARAAGAFASRLRDRAGAVVGGRGDRAGTGNQTPAAGGPAAEDPPASGGAAVDVGNRADETMGADSGRSLQRFDAGIYQGGQTTRTTVTDRRVIERADAMTADATRTSDARTRQEERARDDGRAAFERVSLGSQSRYATAERDDTVLGGLHYTTAAPRAAIVDDGWAASLRGFGRATVWCLPVAVLLLALSAAFGWPSPGGKEPSAVSPGTWVVLTTLGLGLWLIGVFALAALVAATPARPWAYLAAVTSALGVAFLGPAVGITGLARPAISRTAAGAQGDPQIGTIAGQMQSRLLNNATGRWLVVGGSVLLIVAVVAVAGTILTSRALTQHDGFLVLLGTGLAVVAALISFQVLFVLAAMFTLAGLLGLSYTAGRIARDGTPPARY